MLMYEGFLDKFYEKLPEVKLAIAFVNFLNSIKPELKCKYKRNTDGISILTQNYEHLIYFDVHIDFIVIKLRDELELVNDIVSDFFLDFPDTITYAKNTTNFKVNKKDILKFIENLTKDSYEMYITKLDAKKYNI